MKIERLPNGDLVAISSDRSGTVYGGAAELPHVAQAADLVVLKDLPPSTPVTTPDYHLYARRFDLLDVATVAVMSLTHKYQRGAGGVY